MTITNPDARRRPFFPTIRVRKLSKQRVLLNHSSQSRWTHRTVFHGVNPDQCYYLKCGQRFVRVYPLYRDWAHAVEAGQRMNAFMCSVRA